MEHEKIIGHPYTDRIVIPAAETRVRYKEPFHMRNLYILLHDWLVEENWTTRNDMNWEEHFYLKRETPQGDEQWIWWRLKKVPGAGEGSAGDNPYFRYLLDIFWHMVGIKDIEVMHQGKKYKTNSADLELYLKAKLELDYQHEVGKGWRDSMLLGPFHDMFQKRLFKQQILKHKHDLYRETYRFQEVVKSFLGLKTYMPEPEGQRFHPEKGIGDLEGYKQ